MLQISKTTLKTHSIVSSQLLKQKLQSKQVYTSNQTFELECSESFDSMTISYSTYGQLNADASNVVWVCHALTADANPKDWWQGLVGENDLFNPDEHFIVCANVIGSPYGSTSPINCQTNKRYEKFPTISIRDNIKVFIGLRKHLGIEKIHTLIGGSMGGHQAMEWAIIEPEICEYLILLCTSAVTSPWVTAFNQSQRLAITADNTWGEKSLTAASLGLKAARSIALLSYRNNVAYNTTQNDEYSFGHVRKAESYQNYQGEKLVNRFDAYGYYSLTKTMDSHDVGRNRSGISHALAKIKAKTLVLGISSDVLFPIIDSQQLVDNITSAKLDVIESDFGHDGFLIETGQITQSIKSFYQADTQQKKELVMYGLGCVGQGVYDLLKNNKNLPQLKSIVVKHEFKARSIGYEIVTTNKQAAIDANVKTVIEVIDDSDVSYRMAKNAMSNNQNYITANKKMVAENLKEIIGLGQTCQLSFLYEAAVAGSIPIIRNLDLFFEQSENQCLKAILNGTSNFILTQMFQNNRTYKDALLSAQDKGYAETNPIADVGGDDAKYKVVILAAHAFGLVVHPDEITNYGVQDIGLSDIEFAKSRKQIIKQVASIKRTKQGVSITVMPEFVDIDSELAKTDNESNLIILQNNDTAFNFKGAGAGSKPTGTAVIADLKACADNYQYDYQINKNLELDNDFKITLYISKQGGFSITGKILEETVDYVIVETAYQDFIDSNKKPGFVAEIKHFRQKS